MSKLGLPWILLALEKGQCGYVWSVGLFKEEYGTTKPD